MYGKFTICTVSLQYVLQTLCTTDMSDCWCDDLLCLQKVTVEAPPGKVAGYVCQSWSLCKPRMRIENAEGETVLRIKGPCCQLNICGDIEFDVSMMSSLLENFIKHWALKSSCFGFSIEKIFKIFQHLYLMVINNYYIWSFYFLFDAFTFCFSGLRPWWGDLCWACHQAVVGTGQGVVYWRWQLWNLLPPGSGRECQGHSSGSSVPPGQCNV